MINILLKTRFFLFLMLLSIFMWFSFNSDAEGQGYPNKPINFMIPYGAGGTTDLTYRAFCDAASKYLGQKMVAINKAGAGGTIASMAVANSEADGYTLGGGTTSPALIAPYSEGSPYKNLDKFKFISNIGMYVYIYCVNKDAPYKTWKEFVEWARANPRGAKVGMPGAVSVMAQGFAISQAAEKERISIAYVAFKSGPEVLTATLGGHISMYASTFDANIKAFIDQGKLQPLAIADMRPPGLMEYQTIPTLKDLYKLEITPNLKAIWGPHGLTNSVVKKLEGAFEQATKDSIFTTIMNNFFMPVVYMNSEETTSFALKTFNGVGELKRKLAGQK